MKITALETQLKDVNAVPGPEGMRGPRGSPGLQGEKGHTGPGLVQGALLFLRPGSAAPDGFTKIGTTKQVIWSLSGKPRNHSLDVYEMN